MATIAQVKNILENAKAGQYVVPFCNSTSADFDGYVVQIDQNTAKAVRIEDWTEGWPDEEPEPTEEFFGITVKYANGIKVYDNVYAIGSDPLSAWDDDTVHTAQNVMDSIEIDKRI